MGKGGGGGDSSQKSTTTNTSTVTTESVQGVESGSAVATGGSTINVTDGGAFELADHIVDQSGEFLDSGLDFAAGLVGGVVGLATNTIDAQERISATKLTGEDATTLNAKLQTDKFKYSAIAAAVIAGSYMYYKKGGK